MMLESLQVTDSVKEKKIFKCFSAHFQCEFGKCKGKLQDHKHININIYEKNKYII